METKALYESFKQPDSIFRTAPLWVWNDDMTPELIDKVLTEYKDHGFGGGFVHPRPGLITEYLSEKWFELWEYALSTAKQLGLKLYIYDENSYPSGFAGGHVPSELPDCLSTSAAYQIVETKELKSEKAAAASWLINNNLIRAYSTEENGRTPKLLSDITDIPMENWYEYGRYALVIEKQEPQLLSWLGGFGNVDILRPEVTKSFLDCTYERYYSKFGKDFGEVIPAIFSDEPAVTGSTIYNFGKKNIVPFSYWFAHQFEKLCGYNLVPCIGGLFLDAECDMFPYDSKKIRYDYYSVMRQLWTENFIKPMGEWCTEHNIAWTGHYMENYWPFAAGIATSPCIMTNYAYMQWPAIDMLQSDIVKYQPSDPMLINILEISSVANQLNKERTLCESYGAGGWDAALPDFKRMADWLMVNGVTFINQHLSYTSIAGSRKRDHPQSFDSRSPWWDDYTLLNDYTARVQTVLACGKAEQRILVVQPTTTGFMIPPEEEFGNLAYKIPITNPNMENYLDMLQALTDGQWDFDLGDEYIMEENAAVKENKLSVGAQLYDIVIVSGNMQNMRSETVTLLGKYLENGGTLFSWGKPGCYVDGLKKPEVIKHLTEMSGWVSFDTLSELEAALAKRLKNRVTDNKLPTGVGHRRRRLENGDLIYFFTNQSGLPFSMKWIPEKKCVTRWNPWDGTSERLYGSEQIITLQPNESLLLMLSDGEPLPARDTKELFVRNELPVSALEVKPESPNMFTIDYCDLTLNGDSYNDINVIHAGALLYRRRGFSANPWDNAIQYKNRLMSQIDFDEATGFRLDYHFYCDESELPEAVSFMAERLEHYTVSCNGTTVKPDALSSSLDEAIGFGDITPYLVHGKNTLSFTAKCFNVLLEPEAIYLKGKFAVNKTECRWVLGKTRELAAGGLANQGYPFYPYAVTHKYEFNLPEDCNALYMQLNDVTATDIGVYLNGAFAGIYDVNCYTTTNLFEFTRAGNNILELRICASLRNLLGPHHDKTKPRNNAWPQNWKNAPRHGMPSPAEYDIIDYGIMSLPVLVAEVAGRTGA